MPDLSIIIVSYNVKYYIQQCISNLLDTSELTLQIIVVDNDSNDGSQQFLKQEFGDKVLLINNEENIGFGAACNIALQKANAEYTLFLNPDTKVDTKVLREVLTFIKENQNIGLIGVRMVDYQNRFLPESKRGLPRPSKAFYKLSGINKLFDKSDSINAYYAPQLDPDERAEVEILSGAFLFGETAVIKRVDGFDEAFFMYGEDIDLSYRLLKEGYKNYYLGDQVITHYKGRSTDHQDIKYVKRFYSAMSVFHKKHFADEYSWLLNFGVQSTIQGQILVKSLRHLLQKLAFPILDFLLFLAGAFLCQRLWGSYFFGDPHYYTGVPAVSHALFATVCWVIILFLQSSYRFYRSASKLIIGLLLGLGIILMIYSLFNVEWRSSRVLFFLYFFWNLIFGTIVRKLFGKESKLKNKRIGILGTSDFIKRLQALKDLFPSINLTGASSLSEISVADHDHLFIERNVVSTSELASVMVESEEESVSTQIMTLEDIYLLLEQSNYTEASTLFTSEYRFPIVFYEKKITKRLFDLIIAVLMLPVSLFSKKYSITDWIDVCLAKKSVVGYATPDDKIAELPKIKEGICPASHLFDKQLNHMHNFEYALNYHIMKDFRCFIKSIFK